MKRIAIIGAGPAGVEAALAAHKAGAESVTLYSRESMLPYARPALPRAAFADGDMSKFTMHPEKWYAENGIDLKLDTPVTGLDTENHLLKTLDGEEFFDAFVLAGGASPLKPVIPGMMASPAVHTLWSADDAKKIFSGLRRGRIVAIVGGGLVGIETALNAAKAGKKVFVLERGQQLLKPILDAEPAALLKKKLAEKGVTVLTETSLASASQVASKLCLKFEGKSDTLDVDMVVLSVGSKANLSLAQSAGLATDRGICVDETLQTSAPDVYAAGDCIQFGALSRFSVMAALEQGRIAGYNATVSSETTEPKIYAPKSYPTRFSCEGISLCAWGQTASQNTYAESVKITSPKAPAGTMRLKIVRNDGVVIGVQMVGTDIGFAALLPKD